MRSRSHKPYQKYTEAEVRWLKKNHVGRSRAELARMFHAEFRREISVAQVKSFVANRKLNSGLTGYFQKGHAPWNLNKKGYMGANRTSFAKGHLPHNHRPLWSERSNKYGYVEISVPERNPHTGFPTRFKHKHVWLWEQAHGKKPRGCAIIFVDGDNRNFDLSNLMLVTRQELLVMNLHNYKNQPQELRPSVLALARLQAKAGVRPRRLQVRRTGQSDNMTRIGKGGVYGHRRGIEPANARL